MAMISKSILLTFLLLSFYSSINGRSVRDFYADRAQIINEENTKYIGGNLQLSDEEQLANDQLMAYKVNELDLVIMFYSHFSMF